MVGKRSAQIVSVLIFTEIIASSERDAGTSYSLLQVLRNRSRRTRKEDSTSYHLLSFTNAGFCGFVRKKRCVLSEQMLSAVVIIKII